ncbi:hypothetical protein D9758_002580 [Tetrapyrgos nigripes]|uniref:PH domain-containing protein n=1 Tax=Tetrapyrgos nigripes TaxID=182062 RepID=A0A8H5LU11_9AGAR|nr:hypothetical protein D9758_002580 [Tetrapyrgos nigripes]
MSSPVSSSPSRRSSTRGSMLVQASDILGNFKFGRRRKSIRQPLPPPRVPIILPEVIEIGPIADAEVEERDRIREEREEAAQALGLAGTPVVDALHSLPNDAVSSIDHASMSQDNHEDHDHSEFQDGELSLDKETVNESISRTSDSTSSPNNQRIPHPYTSSISVSIPPTPTSPMASVIMHGRHRSGSMPAAPHSHNRSSSIISTPVPPFPSTPSALAQFIQISSTLPKFYPSSSLRIFALTRQWKNRFMVLSTPVALPTFSSRNRNPTVSYLHLFKSSSAEDKELERLEINEDSVVFVSEEEVGGRRHVIKVGGRDVGALKKELNTEDGGRTMWFLQITDSAESHKWITSIKNAIFGQRTMRAGLGHSNPGSGVIEPRGDMDVMLSMRTQGIINSPTQSKSDGMDTKSQRSPTFSVSQDTSRSYAASVASVRTQATVPKSNNTSGGAVLTLKGLFTGANGITVGRPRSSSRATSLVEGESQSHGEDAVGGNNLMSMLGTSGTESMGSGSLSDSSQTHSGAGGSIVQPTSHPHTHVARALSLSSASSPLNNRHANQHTHGSIMSTISGSPLTNDSCPSPIGSHPGPRLDRKILANPIAIESGSKLNSKSNTLEGLGLGNGGLSPRRRDADSHVRPMSAGSISLHPPPRKRWTSSGTTPLVYTDSPTTISAQLPPDTHSEMGVMGMGFHVQNASTSSIVNGNGNGTVENGMGVDTEGQDLFNSSFSFGTPPQRPRSASSRSARSVSTLGSVHSTSNSPIPGGGGGSSSPGVDRSSIGTKRSSGARRWSRQLPQRLTPPSIPPPAIPMSHTQNGSVNGNGSSPFRHPYSAEKRSSSQSQSSGTSELHLPSKFSKRASASSAFSVKSTSTNQSFGSTSHVRAGSNRASVPPPPRPAPTLALPSAPVSESGSSVPNSASATPPLSTTPSNSKRSSFRESMTKTNRALRLSLSTPKPPPSGVLPPRPDEASRHRRSKSHSLGQNPSQGHRRSHSGSSSTKNSSLYSIPGSPGTPSPLLASPFPPPRGPLPPTPPTVTPYNNEISPVIPHPSSRASSMKRRLRILSAPPPTNTSTPASAFINGLSGSTRSSTMSPTNLTFNVHNTSLPSTPILNQYDSSFLSLATPATPSLPTPKIHTLTEPEPEPVISLSPPPRRGSKRISIVDSVGGGSIHEEPGSVPPLPKPLPDPLPDPLPSAASAVVPVADSPDHGKPQSRHGSVISLGIVSV